MKKTSKKKTKNGLRKEYDFSKLGRGVRGKYLRKYQAGTNLILLSPDVAAYFPDQKSVDSALRGLINAEKQSVRRARR